MDGDSTRGKTALKPNWQPGQSGNPAGRPKGSKNKLCEDFLGDMQEAWKAHGKEALNKMATTEPSRFVATVASLVPKDMNLNINDDRELTEDELLDRIRQIDNAIAPFLADREIAGGAHGADTSSSQLPARIH